MTGQVNLKRLLPLTFVSLFFIGLFFTGLFIYTDYGISSDEIINWNNGNTTYRYVFEGDNSLLSYRDRYYGVAFEFILIMLERLFNMSDYRSILLMRHFTTFISFYAGVIFMYLLSKRHFNDWRYGILGALMLVTNPRIFAQSFYNSKDVTFCAVFIITLYTLILFLEKRSVVRALAHAFVCAFLIDIRVIGVLVPFFTVFLVPALDSYTGRERAGRNWIFMGLYLAALAFFVVMLWPVLWTDPIGNFIQAFKQMSSYPWEGTNLYLGKYVWAVDVPWHYVPVWMLMTIPVAYTVMFLFGAVQIIKNIFAGIYRNAFDFNRRIIFIASFLAPITAVIVLKAVLYDGWRHMYFVYPAFVLIALVGLKESLGFIRKRIARPRLRSAYEKAVKISVLGSICAAIYIMISMHPHQYVYFNVLTGNMRAAKRTFDMDYWGVAYSRALEYIADNDDRKKIKVSISTLRGNLGYIPAFMLPDEKRSRFIFLDSPKDADYFISNYRWHPHEYSFGKKYYDITAGGASICSVYKLYGDVPVLSEGPFQPLGDQT